MALHLEWLTEFCHQLLVPAVGADAGMGAAPGGEELVVEMDEVVEVFEAGGKY